METRLQSPEVRIPKTDTRSPPSCLFKSSFARSLSFSTNQKPIDLEISFRIAQNLDTSPSSNQQIPQAVNLTPQHSMKDEDFSDDFEKSSPNGQPIKNITFRGRPLSASCFSRNRLQVIHEMRTELDGNFGVLWRRSIHLSKITLQHIAGR